MRVLYSFVDHAMERRYKPSFFPGAGTDVEQRKSFILLVCKPGTNCDEIVVWSFSSCTSAWLNIFNMNEIPNAGIADFRVILTFFKLGSVDRLFKIIAGDRFTKPVDKGMSPFEIRLPPDLVVIPFHAVDNR